MTGRASQRMMGKFLNTPTTEGLNVGELPMQIRSCASTISSIDDKWGEIECQETAEVASYFADFT
jgi:hypothetical protein